MLKLPTLADMPFGKTVARITDSDRSKRKAPDGKTIGGAILSIQTNAVLAGRDGQTCVVALQYVETTSAESIPDPIRKLLSADSRIARPGRAPARLKSG